MPTLAENVAAVRSEIAAACKQAGRDPATVRLIAVTKTQVPGILPGLRQLGITDFGENRQEHLSGMISQAQAGDQWHFIGRIQGRQLAKIAPVVTCLHSLCEADHVERLARACSTLGRRLPVFLQANVSGEASKAGLSPEALPAVLESARAQASLEVIGLMTMAPELESHASPAQIRDCFGSLRLLAQRHGLSRLSMGMSGDFPIAIAEGATDIRVGSRLFA